VSGSRYRGANLRCCSWRCRMPHVRRCRL